MGGAAWGLGNDPVLMSLVPLDNYAGRVAELQEQCMKAWHLPLPSGGPGVGRYSLLQNLDAQVSRWGMALLKGHLGLVPRLFQPYTDADVLDDFEPQDPVGTECLGRLQATGQG